MVMERWRQFRTNFGRVGKELPESRSGLTMGDFANRTLSSTTLAPRDVIAKPPPLFLEKISYLAVIMRDSSGSKQGLGLGRRAQRRETYAYLRTIPGRNFSHVPDPNSRLKIGQLLTSLC